VRGEVDRTPDSTKVGVVDEDLLQVSLVGEISLVQVNPARGLVGLGRVGGELLERELLNPVKRERRRVVEAVTNSNHVSGSSTANQTRCYWSE